MKLYELTVERTPQEAEEGEVVTIPRVDNMEQFQGKCSTIIINLKSSFSVLHRIDTITQGGVAASVKSWGPSITRPYTTNSIIALPLVFMLTITAEVATAVFSWTA